MRRYILILAIVIWIFSLIILIIALTNIYPNNPFKDYRFIIGIAFLSISGFTRIIVKNQNVEGHSNIENK